MNGLGLGRRHLDGRRGAPSSPSIGEAKADEAGFSFVQISDSHIGLQKPANRMRGER